MKLDNPCAENALKITPNPAVVDRDLQVVIRAWDSLPEPIKIGVLALVRAGSGQK